MMVVVNSIQQELYNLNIPHQKWNKGRCGKDLNLKNKYKISAEKSQKKRTLGHMWRWEDNIKIVYRFDSTNSQYSQMVGSCK